MTIDLSKLSQHVGHLTYAEEKDLLCTFYTSLVKRHQDIVEAVRLNNWQHFKALTHSLKSSSLYYGARPLHLCCEQGEQLVDTKQLGSDVIQKWLADFTQHSYAAQCALAEVIKQLDTAHD